MIEMGLLEWKKPYPSSKVIRKVMKDAFALRRQWIIAEAPSSSQYCTAEVSSLEDK